MILFLTLACAGPAPGDKHPDETPVEDTGTPPDPDEVPGAIPPIFDDTVLHTIHITLSESSVEALRADPYGWAPGDVTLDGVTVSEIGVRLRGKIGSFRTIDQKPKFKFDFGEYVEGQRFQGLKHLALNNEVVDCSYLKEMVGYSVFRAMGYPASLSSYAQVQVNGEDYGLYVLVEFPDDRFMVRNFGHDEGNLYDGKYLWYGDWDYALADFTPEWEDNFELEEGEDVGRADIYRITDALQDSGPLATRLDPLVDSAELHRFMMLEQWIGHIDGYTLDVNNYRVWFRPDDGRAVMLPWDLDYAFLQARVWGFSWNKPSGAIAIACWDDEDCKAEHAELIAQTTWDPSPTLEKLDQWTALIEDAAEADPRRECASNRIGSSQAAVRSWVEDAESNIHSFWSDD